MATEGNANDPELRLLRYLYIGKEYPNYQPGYWFAHHYFIVRNVLAIEELAENEEKQLVPIELITKVNTDTICLIHLQIFIIRYNNLYQFIL